MAATSPFPGMDPYLEEHWRDVHQSLIIYAREFLQPQLPGDLRCRVEERITLTDDAGETRSRYPDVRIKESWSNGGGGVAVATPVAEGVKIRLRPDEPKEGFLEIREVGSNARVVTVIEFLSESNKLAVKGRLAYAQKQLELEEGGVSLVEVDLLRSGHHVVVAPLDQIPARHRTPYLVCIRRGWLPYECEVISIPMRSPLPTIPIPLRQTDPEVKLDIAAIVAKVYTVGAFDDIDYRRDLDPPLAADDQRWAEELLRIKGLR